MLIWDDLLPAKTTEKCRELLSRAQGERDAGKEVYPPQENILRALDLTPPETVKVVILGQDPYHEPGQGNGLAFSVNPGVRIPPSLKNIFKELRPDMGCEIPVSGDLTAWTKQGVLLLNTVLTVEQGMANSHKSWGWQEYVKDILQVCADLPQPVVFLLWGSQAHAMMADVELGDRKCLIKSSHPSPLGALKKNGSNPAFIGSRPFSRTNLFLSQNGSEPINWAL